MDRLRKTLILIAVIAVPAAAHSTFAPGDDLCFASGAATYKLSPNASWPDRYWLMNWFQMGEANR